MACWFVVYFMVFWLVCHYFTRIYFSRYENHLGKKKSNHIVGCMSSWIWTCNSWVNIQFLNGKHLFFNDNLFNLETLIYYRRWIILFRKSYMQKVQNLKHVSSLSKPGLSLRTSHYCIREIFCGFNQLQSKICLRITNVRIYWWINDNKVKLNLKKVWK